MAGLTLGQFPLPLVTSHIERFAREYRRGGRPARYILFGNVLLDEAHVLANPGLMMRIMSHHRQLVKVDMPLTAQFILATNNLRVEGLAGDARIGAKLRARDGGLYREVRARRVLGQALAGANLVAIPGLIDRDRRHGKWFVEERVPGRHVNATELIAFFSGPLERFYSAAVRPHAVRRTASASDPDVALVMPRFEEMAKDATWPVALCHGDLQAKNILVGDAGQFWLVDLELSGAGPLAVDLARACAWEPRLEPLALAILARFSRGGDWSPARQLALGYAARLAALRERRAGFIAERLAVRGRPRSETALEVDADYGRIVARAQELAALD